MAIGKKFGLGQFLVFPGFRFSGSGLQKITGNIGAILKLRDFRKDRSIYF